jgi:hypothetical protein
MAKFGIMLKPSHNNAWSNPEFRSECLNSSFAALFILDELPVLFRGNQKIRGKLIGLIFF